MQEKIVSVSIYAKMRGVSRQRIQFLIKNQLPLPGVKYYFKTGSGTSHYVIVLGKALSVNRQHKVDKI